MVAFEEIKNNHNLKCCCLSNLMLSRFDEPQVSWYPINRTNDDAVWELYGPTYLEQKTEKDFTSWQLCSLNNLYNYFCFMLWLSFVLHANNAAIFLLKSLPDISVTKGISVLFLYSDLFFLLCHSNNWLDFLCDN